MINNSLLSEEIDLTKASIRNDQEIVLMQSAMRYKTIKNNLQLVMILNFICLIGTTFAMAFYQWFLIVLPNETRIWLNLLYYSVDIILSFFQLIKLKIITQSSKQYLSSILLLLYAVGGNNLFVNCIINFFQTITQIFTESESLSIFQDLWIGYHLSTFNVSLFNCDSNFIKKKFEDDAFCFIEFLNQKILDL